jgi:hypothetical protein
VSNDSWLRSAAALKRARPSLAPLFALRGGGLQDLRRQIAAREAGAGWLDHQVEAGQMRLVTQGKLDCGIDASRARLGVIDLNQDALVAQSGPPLVSEPHA